MISSQDARQYLDQTLGITVPSIVIDAAVQTIAPAELVMQAAGYPPAKRTLVQLMAVAIVAAAGSPRRLGSQSAPSGASRSFHYDSSDLSDLRKALAALDTAGTVAELVGPDPSTPTMFLVV